MVEYRNKWMARPEVLITINLINTLERLYRTSNTDVFYFEGDEVDVFIKLMPIYCRRSEGIR